MVVLSFVENATHTYWLALAAMAPCSCKYTSFPEIYLQNYVMRLTHKYTSVNIKLFYFILF